MNPLQTLITLALPSTCTMPNLQRATLLTEAAKHLDKDAAAACRAEALCLRNAESHQMKLEQLLSRTLPLK